MKKMILCFTFFIVNCVHANQLENEEAVYSHGPKRNRHYVVTIPMKERPGSFLVALIHDQRSAGKMEILLADPIDGQYLLTPFVLSDDRFSQVSDPNPSYRFIFTDASLKVSPLNNQTVFTEFEVSLKKSSRIQVSELQSQDYTTSKSQLTVSGDGTELAADLTRNNTTKSFQVFSQLPRIYMFHELEFNASGMKVADNSYYQAIVLKDKRKNSVYLTTGSSNTYVKLQD